MTGEAEPFLGFSPQIFRTRRERVLESMESGALVLPAAPLRHRSRDSEYPYRPSSELFYLTGFVEEGGLGVFRKDADGVRFVLFVRGRDPKAERWSGPRLGPEAAKQIFEPDEVHPVEEMEDRFPPLLLGVDRLYVRLDEDPAVRRHALAALARARSRGARDGSGPRGILDPGLLLDPLRLRKDPEEVQALREAAARTVAGFLRAMAATRPGMGEWEMEAILEGAFRSSGAQGPAFPTIVGSGENGCVLHYVANASRIQEGDLVLLDGGAEVRLYAGDVTRTFPASGRFSSPQRKVYEAVLAARAAALSAIRPGATVGDVHQAAVRALTAELRSLGVLSGSMDQLLEEEAHKEYFPHRTSHWLGLDVHDPGDYASGGKGTELEPGMVLTVEPGLYFPSDLEEEGAGEFAGIGVRIEDDVLVTEDGMENLTDDLPVLPEEVEAVVGSAG